MFRHDFIENACLVYLYVLLISNFIVYIIIYITRISGRYAPFILGLPAGFPLNARKGSLRSLPMPHTQGVDSLTSYMTCIQRFALLCSDLHNLYSRACFLCSDHVLLYSNNDPVNFSPLVVSELDQLMILFII